MAENWLRWHVGTGKDPKWRVIARRCGQPIHACLAVWSMMLECAADAPERGTLDGWNDEDVAAALDLDEADVAAIRGAMQGKVLDGDLLTAWSKRQPKREREDDSSERVRQFRERQKALKAATDGDVTPRNASVTPCNALEESREDKKEPSSLRSDVVHRSRAIEFQNEFAETFWPAYPTKAAKKASLKAFLKARQSASLETIIAGLERYIATKPPDRDWAHAATWLNGDRWNDEAPPPRPPPTRTVPYSNASLARSLLQDIEHDHNSADPSRNGADVQSPGRAGERGSGAVIPIGRLRLSGPDEAESG